MSEIERARQISKSLRSLLAQVAEMSDVALSEAIGLEPWESPEIDLSIPREYEEILVTGVGLALQVLVCTAQAGTVKLYINRKDGFCIDPTVDGIIPFFPITKIYLVVKPGATGILKFRVYKDPSFLFTATPQAQVSFVKMKNLLDQLINPATEETLSSLNASISTLSSSGTSGQVSVSTSGTNLSSYALQPYHTLILWADRNNNATVAINFGSAATPGTHAELNPGEGLQMRVTNTSIVYLKASAGTQKVHYIVI